VLHLAFNETSGATCLDSSGNGLNGTMVNFTTTGLTLGTSGRSASGRLGNCIILDGSADVVTVADNALLDFNTSFSMTMWMYPPNPLSSLSSYGYPISKGYGDQAGGAWSVNIGGATYSYVRDVGDTSSKVIVWVPTIQDRWFHFAYTFDGSSSPTIGRVFVDGIAMTSATWATNSALHTNNLTLYVGRGTDAPYGFKGYLDEVKLWPVALTQTQIAVDRDLAGNVPVPTTETWGNFETAGVTVRVSPYADWQQDAVCSLQYRKDPSATWITGHPLSRVDKWRAIGSLFYLDDATTYDIRVTFADATSTGAGQLNGAAAVETSVTTRAEASITTPAAPANSIYVSPTGNDSWLGTLTSPVLTVAHALVHLHGSDTEIVLRAGTYYEGDLSITTSGVSGAPVWIHGYPGETAILDGRTTAALTWTDTGTSSIYQADVGVTDCFGVYVNGRRLFPRYDITSLGLLKYLSGGTYYTITGPGASMVNGTTVSIHLTGDKDPNTTTVVVGGRHRAFYVNGANFVWFSNLTFQYYDRWGTGSQYGRAIYLNNAGDVVVRNCVFSNGPFAVEFGGANNRTTFEDNTIANTWGYDWTWGMMKHGTGELSHIRLADMGRGFVCRRNDISGGGDGMSPTAFGTGLTNLYGLTEERDITSNTIHHCIDDLIECDGNYSNIRIWGNTLHHGERAVSTAPVWMGPVYIFRNVIYNLNSAAWKFQQANDWHRGFWFAYHNSIYSAGQWVIYYGSTYAYRSIVSRNNIYYGQNTSVYNFYRTFHPLDFDYDNLYRSNAGIWGDWYHPVTQVQQTQYNFADFQSVSGQEAHGMGTDPGYVDAANGDLHITAASPCIDAGVVIPGINNVGPDAYDGVAPDIGRYKVPSPEAPKNLSVTKHYGQYARGTSNTATWSAVPGATSYSLEWSTTESFSADETTTSGWISQTFHQATNLENAKYYYRVKCCNAYGHESKWSGVISAIQDSLPPETGALSLPDFTRTDPFLITPTGGDVGGSGLATIELRYRYGWTTATLNVYGSNLPPTSPINFIPKMGNGMYYFYTIGTDRVGNVETMPTQPSADTWVLIGSLLDPVLKPEPAYTKGRTNTVSWLPPDDSKECDLQWSTYYSFPATNSTSVTGRIQSHPPSSTSYTVTNLNDGTKYFYRVTSYDFGTPPSERQSNIVSSTQDATSPTVPGIPTAPGIPTDGGLLTSSTSVRFNWTAATDPGATHSGVASYDLQVGTTPGGSGIFNGTVGNVLTKTVTGANGQTLYARVRARDAVGNNGVWSGNSKGIAVDTVRPRLVSVAVINGATLNVTFNEPVSNADKVGNYTCTGGIRIGYALGLNEMQYRLYTTDQTPGTRYTLTVSSAVKDRAGNAIDLAYCSLAFFGGGKTGVRSWELYR
jgi:hypothetical protein